MCAVLAFDEIDLKHHSGIISEFRRRYIKTGISETRMSEIISVLFDVRTDSDYDDFFRNFQSGYSRADRERSVFRRLHRLVPEHQISFKTHAARRAGSVGLCMQAGKELLAGGAAIGTADRDAQAVR